MKTIPANPSTTACGRANYLWLTALVVALSLLGAWPARGVTVLSKAANAEVLLNVPYLGEIELENPLAGNEIVAGRSVLDWRDAETNVSPAFYEDWTVNNPPGIDGWSDQIWLRNAGDAAWTTTMVPSTVVSIHLNGDNNDGVAEVLVDGTRVAMLDMFFAGAGRETALVLVKGLANTVHTIQVNDLGQGAGGDDVHINGAAALRSSPLKWDQPPVLGQSTNVYYGWNEPSVADPPMPGPAADDWVCTTTNPVTRIRWWGSFAGWISNSPPPYVPSSFQILFWTDVPAFMDAPFSHPGGVEWQINCSTFTWQFVGYDYDPRTGTYESCFLFEQKLSPTEYFTQTNAPGTIHWLSIGAVYPSGTAGPWPFGWKTRPRDLSSPAPDDAVASDSAAMPPWTPLFWPTPEDSWDLAFELICEQTGYGVKWEQVPDLSTMGMDVDATFNPSYQTAPTNLLADDFLCTSPGPITNITIWGSWTNDYDWQSVLFTLSIHADIPASQSPSGYSMPGQLLWVHPFGPGQWVQSLEAAPIYEWWFRPPNIAVFPGDHMCFRYDFAIPSLEAFVQEGSETNPVVYWLDVQAQLMPQQTPPPAWVRFGWKTCPTNWNDDAVWIRAQEPYNGIWNRLTYPAAHPRAGQTVDLAFRLNAGETTTTTVKWSQPPVATNGPGLYHGWNEVSWYGGEFGYPIIADDWVCATTNPVTDIHWWGSFIGWTEEVPPQLPDQFRITFWTDVPADTNVIGSFSHPGMCLWMATCTNYTWQFVGYDVDPRDGTLESCYKFEQDFATNEWFYQDPLGGTNIYWVSIAAVYYNPIIANPWGWKTRPRDLASPAPDDAVRIFDPTAPLPGMVWIAGDPIWWPDTEHSWDMAFQLTTRWPDEQDFGDAPDPGYPTLLGSVGARHFILPGFNLGWLIDSETNGQPDSLATGDDVSNLADEDGVFFVPPILVGTQAWVNVFLTSPSGTGQLDAWLDFNRNGSWEGTEQVFNSLILVSGTNTLPFTVPTNASVGPTFARFRLSSAGGLTPAGAAGDGEVEDLRLLLLQRAPQVTNIVITNIVITTTNATVWWNAEQDIHYWLLATYDLSTWLTNWTWIGSEVIGPINYQTESYRYFAPTNRFFRVTAPYTWP